ncbi:MAG: preprotein translocase subunit YajC [Oscillospiraceae bacterium]
MTNFLMEVQPNTTTAFVTQIGLLALMFGFLYFFMIRPQKKKDKELANMRSALDVGDEIITIGGIIGIVVSIKDDTLVIETGSDRSKIRISKWAIQSNLTVKEKPALKEDAAKTEKAEKTEKVAKTEKTEKAE